jgi:hypothetical protein
MRFIVVVFSLLSEHLHLVTNIAFKVLSNPSVIIPPDAIYMLDMDGLESREYGRRNPSRWPRGTLYPQKLEIRQQAAVARSV